MNKKGVESLLSLFVGTIGLVLIIAFFSIFASLLLISKSYTGSDIETTTHSLILNLEGFLQSDNVWGIKNWQVFNVEKELSLRTPANVFLSKTYPISETGYSSYFLAALYDGGEEEFNKKGSANTDSFKSVFSMGGDKVCDMKDKKMKAVQLYIPQIKSGGKPSAVVLCVGT